jgi:hypothetical protein
MADIVEFKAPREAKQPERPALAVADPWEALAGTVEKLAGLNTQIAAALVAVEQAVARNTADIAGLKEGIAALLRMMPRPTDDD